MPLSTLDQATLVRQQAAAIQAQASVPLNLNPGSVLLAFLEAEAATAMWLQTLVVQLLQAARLSTATGPDVDSFVADFGLTRLPAKASTGTVTFSRTTTTQSAVIPAGTVLQTADGTQQFTVIADTTQNAWNAAQNAYIIPVGTASITATVQNVLDTTATAGTDGNVLANTITTLTAPIQGVQTVTNAAAFINGVNAESDAALKARFTLFLQGLREGTKSAVGAAIDDLQQGIQYTLVENQTVAGAAQNGFFYVVINPSTSALQTQVTSAIDAIRPLGVTFSVIGATTVTATVVMTVTVLAGYTHANVASAVQTAIQNFINGLGLGQSLYFTQLYAVAYGVAGVNEVSGLTLNGGTADITASSQQVIQSGTVTVN